MKTINFEAAAKLRGRLEGSKWVFDNLGLSLFAHDVAQLSLAQKGEPAAGQWRPIETAPRDGSRVLLFEKYEDVPFVGYWWGNREWVADQTFYNTDGDACVIDIVSQQFVTHWMPLPAAPSA